MKIPLGVLYGRRDVPSDARLLGLFLWRALAPIGGREHCRAWVN